MRSRRSEDVYDDTNWYILLAGLPRPPRPLTLGHGLTLRPLESQISVFDLAAAGAVGFREWAVLEPMAESCSCEIESAKDSEVVPGYDALNRAWLASALLVLRGFTNHLSVACSSYTWDTIAGHQKRTSYTFGEQLRGEGVNTSVFNSNRELPPFKGGLLDYHMRTFVADLERDDPVNDTDAEWVRDRYPLVNDLAADDNRFRFALEAAVDWRYTQEMRSAIARIWSGIEAFFGINSELVYRISLMSASLLEQRGDRRKLRFESVRKLYALRSKAVHGEPLSPEILQSAMSDSFHLLRDLLLVAIGKGRALGKDDFDDAIFA